MSSPHRTGAGAVPADVRCGEPSAPLARSWAGVGTGRRRGSAPAPRSASALPAAVLAALILTLGGAAYALAEVPSRAAAAAPLGTLPAPVPAASTAGIEPAAPPPRRLAVPRLGLDVPLVRLGLTADGALAAPDDPRDVGWHRAGTAPGDPGPAVLAGHVDSYEGAGVFFRLRELQPGDRVQVGRVDGSVIDFEVYASEAVAKDGFPTERVYGRTAGPELRLITCGGTFDEASRSYTENLVVYARQVVQEAT